MYRNLFFDADGTLFDFSLAEKIAFSLLAEDLGFPDTEKSLDLYKKANALCWKEFEQGAITLTELKTKRFTDFFALTDFVFDSREASNTYEGHLSKQGILFQESLPLLQTLTKRGYRLFLATNGIAQVQRGRIATSGLDGFFDGIFISEELGVQKPDTQFFSHMLEKTGLAGKKEECIMIGDSLSSDIKGAFDSNLDTLWYNPDDTITELSPSPTYVCRHLSDLLELFPQIY
jgi:putative hydrolase of the HAD superfamily